MLDRNRIRATATLAFALLAGFSSPAGAQLYARQVWNQLQDVHDLVADISSYRLRNYIIASLDHGRTDAWTFNFTRGQSLVITGACDEDCSDLDIVVKDEAGTVIARDESDDDVPIVTFRATRAGKYRIEVKMYRCNDNPCYFGFGVFNR